MATANEAMQRADDATGRAADLAHQAVDQAQDIQAKLTESASGVNEKLQESAHELSERVTRLERELAVLTSQLAERSEGLAGRLPAPMKARVANVPDRERLWSLVAGAPLVLFGLARRGPVSSLVGLLGGEMLYRGVTGNCLFYEALGINRRPGLQGAATSVPHDQGIRVEETVYISRPREEVYAFWRELENLPRFMTHLESVQSYSPQRSHWVVKGPAGSRVEWDAEIVNEAPGERLAWRSLDGADVPNAGSVQFMKGPGGHGTRLKVEIEYIPPAGPLGAAVAKAFGEEPSQQVHDDLMKLKEILEAQPSGNGAG